jgi:hypothetical protein
MNIFKRKPQKPAPLSTQHWTKLRPSYDKLRDGKFILLTVDLQPHPDYEPVPVRYRLSAIFEDIQMDREVTIRLGDRGASGFGVIDDETGELAQYQRITLYPQSNFTWEFHETAEDRREAELIERQRKMKDVL